MEQACFYLSKRVGGSCSSAAVINLLYEEEENGWQKWFDGSHGRWDRAGFCLNTNISSALSYLWSSALRFYDAAPSWSYRRREPCFRLFACVDHPVIGWNSRCGCNHDFMAGFPGCHQFDNQRCRLFRLYRKNHLAVDRCYDAWRGSQQNRFGKRIAYWILTFSGEKYKSLTIWLMVSGAILGVIMPSGTPGWQYTFPYIWVCVK